MSETPAISRTHSLTRPLSPRSALGAAGTHSPDFPEAAPRPRPFASVSVDQVSIPIWRTRWRDKKRRKAYVAYTLAWSDATGRHREKRADLARAKARAQEIATSIANGEVSLLAFTQADRASLQRAREILSAVHSPQSTAGLSVDSGLRTVDCPLELAVAEYSACLQKLVGRGTLSQAVDFFLEHCPAGAAPKCIPELVAELLAARRQIGGRGRPVCERWADSLEQQLGRFAQRFTGPLHVVTSADIDSWLSSLRGPADAAVRPQTRQNYRAAVLALVRYAQAKRQLPETWRELDHVAALKPEDREIKILTPEQLTRLLAVAPQSLTPFLAIAAFAGVRHEEMTGKKKTLLDWRDIDLEAGTLYVRKTVAKTGRDRLVPLQPNLIAWLQRYYRPNGRVCQLKNSSNALTRAKRRAGIPAGRGDTRNALRKSFISYRLAVVKNIAQVAEEAGTSAAKIRSNYKRPAPEKEGARWFNIWPTTADVVQLRFAGL